MRTGKAGCCSVSENCKHITPSVWPLSVLTVHRPRLQFLSIVNRSLYTSFQGRVTDRGIEPDDVFGVVRSEENGAIREQAIFLLEAESPDL